MTAAEIAAALDGRKSGRAWWARCPAHQDKRPSLELTDAGGKVLVRCWSGCSQADVIAALKARGLWPERPPLTAEERREWGRKRRMVEEGVERLQDWFTGCGGRLQDEAISAEERDDLEALAAASRELFLLRSARLPEMVGLYRDAEPGLRQEDQRAGARWRRLRYRIAAAVVARDPGKLGILRRVVS